LTDSPGGNGCSSWFPDGSRLAFHSGRHDQSELYALSLADNVLERLTDSSSRELCPTVSRDGRRIVFQRRATDVHEHIDLFMMEFWTAAPTST
jgi:TolB protein